MSMFISPPDDPSIMKRIEEGRGLPRLVSFEEIKGHEVVGKKEYLRLLKEIDELTDKVNELEEELYNFKKPKTVKVNRRGCQYGKAKIKSEGFSRNRRRAATLVRDKRGRLCYLALAERSSKTG